MLGSPGSRLRGHSSAGRASRLQREGRRFDPDWLHQTNYLSQRVMSHALRLLGERMTHGMRIVRIRVCSLKIRQFVLTLKRKRICLWFECRIREPVD